MTLRIALFGQAAFGKDTLDQLREKGHDVVGVFAPPEGSRPDALAERGAELGIPLVRRRYYRKKTGEAIPAALEAYRALNADLNVLASVQVFLPERAGRRPEAQERLLSPVTAAEIPRRRGDAVADH